MRHSPPSRRLELLALVLLFAVVVAAVNPRGEFPLDDDWDFAFDTWTWAETGKFQFTPFTAATLRAQIVWGAAWSKVFGRSFEVLRASTLCLSLATTLLFNVFLASLRVPFKPRALMTLSLLFHPIFFWASFTYMTHVPFVFLSLVSLCLFHTAITRRSDWFSVLGATAVVLSFLVRQVGVANAIPPILALIHLRRELGVRSARLALPPILAIMIFVALFAFTSVLVPSAEEHKVHRKTVEWTTQSVLRNFVMMPSLNTAFNFMTGALLFLPVATAAALSRRSWTRRWVLLSASLVALFLIPATTMIRVRNAFPYRNGGNVFANLGLGPQTLRDTFHLGYLYPPAHLGNPARAALTLLAAVLGAGLVVLLIRSASERHVERDRLAVILASYSAFSGAFILCFMKFFMDRYSLDALWSLPILGALVVDWSQRRTRWTAAIAVAVVAIFSVTATQEYLAWNRARWDAYRFLRKGGVTLEQMDGGYEINAFLALKTGRKDLGKRGFAVMDDRYLITFNLLPGYRPLAGFPYPRLFGARKGYVFALERSDPAR
ncbi:MAG TPA: hypothetical protein VNM92_10875 [Thermoanaerobaculia bacterium]|nr:hypothetical protein [Thermoanaerobaculia bacterium]